MSERDGRPARTLEAMRAGADVIVQAALADDRWLGYADVLRKVPLPSPAFGDWSYEAHDTKLSRETRGGTILQLCVYSDLLGVIQGRTPDCFRVVTPAGIEAYRFEDFGAFYRQIKARLFSFLESDSASREPEVGPDPVDHCSVCRWWSRCNSERRAADHLSFVAGLGRQPQAELEARGITTLKALAKMPTPLQFKPARGSKETYARLQDQARLQCIQRKTKQPTYELLTVKPLSPPEPGDPPAPRQGLALLPEPRPGDLFLDLEGDPFGRAGAAALAGEGSREYLFGLGRLRSDGSFAYTARWAFSDGEERQAFDEVMAEIMAAFDEDPAIHVYHYAPYEPSAFKRLSGRCAAREVDLDRLLRGGRFVDLYGIVRHTLRAGVEHYSIKDLEPFYGFTREVELDEAGDRRRVVEVALETGDVSCVTPEIRETVEGYNRDDCRSTLELRGWLETLRDGRVAAGDDLPRPPLNPDEANEKIKERDRRAIELRSALLADVPTEAAERTADERARYVLAYLVDWHRREERVAWGEYHRLREKPDDELIDEPGALVGLRFLERVVAPGGRIKTAVNRYAYPVQENDVRKGDDLCLPNDDKVGSVAAIDKTASTIDIKKTKESNALQPTVVIAVRIVNTLEQEESLQRTAEAVVKSGLGGEGTAGLVADCLLARPPRLKSGPFVRKHEETASDFAVRAALDLDDTLLGIQGPPGAGKTFTGARMIAALIAAGRKVGVTATGHKVIRKLLLDTVDGAKQPILGGPEVRRARGFE